MTKASIKNTFTVLFILSFVGAFSVGSFAKTALAQDANDANIGYGDLGGDTGWYDTGSGYSADTGYYDTGSGYSADTGYYDTGSAYTPDTGYSDVGSAYTPDTGYYDVGSGYSPDTGYYDVGSEYSPSIEENGVSYTEQTYPTESASYSSYSTPSTFSSPPSYSNFTPPFTPPFTPQAPFIPSAPIVQNIPIAYQHQQQFIPQPPIIPQPPVVIPQQPAPVTNNTCLNYSCNTVTSISNSGNTTTVVPVAQTPVTYPVQYTFPQNVSCTISASPNSIQSGQYTYLTWQSYGATSATLTNYGNVAPNGSLSVQPYGSMNYILTVYGQSGQTATCNTYITIGNNYPSVSLSQIPYTGFDFGTAGDAMYWALLSIFALAAGYLLVYYKGGMAIFAGSMIPSYAKTSKSKPAHYVAPVATNVAADFAKASTAKPVVEQKIETPTSAPVKFAAIESLPAFSNVRPTNDSMSIAHHDGAPRIVISRN